MVLYRLTDDVLCAPCVVVKARVAPKVIGVCLQKKTSCWGHYFVVIRSQNCILLVDGCLCGPRVSKWSHPEYVV